MRRAWIVWGVALSAYLLAIFHRSSLAVAGLAAADRFDISAAQLATFTMLQLLVYAGMQIPVGLLVDRYGPRSVMLTGAIVLTLAQAGFALAESYGAALVARVFVGMGDAMTWICLLRLVTSWFSGRRIPFVTALSGTLGQLGAIGAAVPMTWALGHLGWTKAYLIAAAVSVVVTAAVAIVVHDAPEGRVLRGPRLTFATIRAQPAGLLVAPRHPAGLLDALRHPVQRRRDDVALGLPLLRQGRAPHRGPGRPAAQPRGRRRDVQRADDRLVHRPASRGTARPRCCPSCASIVAVWTAVLVWPGDAPFWLLVLLTQVIGIGGPASMIGFDLARTSNPAERLASANGIINQAGFSASLVLVVAIGLILDWRTPGSSTAYDASAFRWAMCAQYPLWALGLLQVWRYRRQDAGDRRPRRADSQRASRGVRARITSSRQSWTAST